MDELFLDHDPQAVGEVLTVTWAGWARCFAISRPGSPGNCNCNCNARRCCPDESRELATIPCRDPQVFSNMRFSTTNALAAIRDASLRNSLLDLQLETAKANRFVKDDSNSSFQVRQLPIYKAPWVATARHSMRPLLHFLSLDLSLEFAFPWFASRYINALFISQSVAGMYYPQDPHHEIMEVGQITCLLADFVTESVGGSIL